MGGLDEIRTVVRSGLMISRDGGGMPKVSKTGSVLQGVIVRVNPGKVDTYRKKVDQLRKIQKRVGDSGQLRVWEIAVGGKAAGNLALGLIYPSIADWAASRGKLEADEEYNRVLATLDELRNVVSVSLFTAR